MARRATKPKRRATKPKVIAAELRAAFDDWKSKQRRFMAMATGKRAYPESVIDSVAESAEDAFEVAYKLVLRATGARYNQACVAILPDGSHLVAVSNDGDDSNEWFKLQLVPACKVVNLS